MKEEKVYFEKQPYFSLQCGLYSVNNLLGSRSYSENQMKAICYDLSDQFINPHKHVFGGDYDVNVMMVALSKKGLSTQWFDRRQLPFTLKKQQTQKQLIGLLINVHSSDSGILKKILKVSGRHWLAVRKINDVFYWIDSKSQGPKEYSSTELQKLVNGLIQEGKGQQNPHILLVYNENK